MARKHTISPLKRKVDALPRSVDFIGQVVQAGITRSTYYRDTITDPKNIPSGRLATYAAILNCEIADLMESYKRVGSKVGLKA